MADASLWGYIANAGIVVKAVMLILLFASLASWTIIFQRSILMRKTKKMLKKFEEKFWSGVDLQQLFLQMREQNSDHSGAARIFQAGFKEYQRVADRAGVSREDVLASIQRSMRIAQNQELEALEKNLSFLATVGSTSPYVGLFGTVWGIMTSLQALGTVSQATIAMVAPGISEALIATAIGLFAAIPAVIAYNRFNNDVNTIANQYQNFQDELSSVLNHKLVQG